MHDSTQDYTQDDDTRLADLPPAEGALLWAMRVWVMGHCRQQDVSERIAAGLGDVGLEGALGHLEGFMWALSRGALRPVAVLCLCRPEVSEDERTLLDVFGYVVEDEAAEAHALLCGLVSEPAAVVALRSAEGVSVCMEEADITVKAPTGRVLH